MENSSGLLCSPLFRGIQQEELASVLSCLSAIHRAYRKGDYIFQYGDKISTVGILSEGSVHIIRDDFWGNRLIMGEASAGDMFGEAYACIPDRPLQVDVTAASDCTVIFLEVQKILTVCSSTCVFHSRLLANLLTVLAGKNLMLTEKISHMAKKTTREKLLSYFLSEARRAGGPAFEIAYNRQQLADYLCVDRSAMSSELGKMQREGIIWFEKNKFCLKEKGYNLGV